MSHMGSVAHIATPVAQAATLAASRQASHAPLDLTSESAAKARLWLGALRSAKPEDRVRLGLEAMAALAVFGPPRCKRPHRYDRAG